MEKSILRMLDLLLAAFCCLSPVSCFQDGLEKGQDTLKVLSEPNVVTMELAPLEFADGTRTSVDLDEDTGLVFNWLENDAVGVYSQEGGLAKFTISGTFGASSALFDGQGFKLTPGNTYTAVYPYDGDRTSPASLEMDYSSRSLNAASSLADLVTYDPLYASSQADEVGSANFSFHHVSSFVRLKCTFPKAGTYTSLDLVPTYDNVTVTGSLNVADGTWQKGTEVLYDNISLEGVKVSSSSEEVSLWLPMAPQDFSGKDLAAFVHDDKGGLYSMRLEGKSFQSGKAYRWNGAMQAYSSSGSSSVQLMDKKTTSLNLYSSIPSGQYSGITKISDTRYAVVHDSAKGGGIHFFDMIFNSDGSVKSCACTVPEGTSSGASSRDAEGIAYFAPANTLFVSFEGSQSILEYDMDGQPTGRALAVPEDMSTSRIGGNYGFEALDYNNTTGLFWTTTEETLNADAVLAQGGNQLLRLQSFNSDLTAGERFFYLLDNPQKSSNGARNYAFGVPDILALDDGRLLIIEREAWIPTGGDDIMGLLDIEFNTVVYVKIYEVDPVHDNGGILNKRLVKSMEIKTATSFANYEGIGFGPVLSGKQSVLMISDSQDRYMSVLQDWLKVLTLN